MLMGGLLIHLTGGRIETHFHVFGSLAFLAFYRDWRVLVPATIVRGARSPAAQRLPGRSPVSGDIVASQWRWLPSTQPGSSSEDVFLFVSCTARRRRNERDGARAPHPALEQEVRTRQQAENDASLTAAQLRVTQQKAEAATRAKSEFLASMSHELRTPLNAILLYSELLTEEAEDQCSSRARSRILQRIHSLGNHLLELIYGILDLSKIRGGQDDAVVGGIRRGAPWCIR